MPDAVKVGFVPFSAAPRGILVVFCDDTLKLGAATRKTLGAAANLVSRAAETNQFKGKSGSTLDILAPEGLKVSRLIVVGAGKLSAIKDSDFLKLGGAAAGKLRPGNGAVTIIAELPTGAMEPDQAAAVASGVRLRAYKFDRYKTKKKDGEDAPLRGDLAANLPARAGSGSVDGTTEQIGAVNVEIELARKECSVLRRRQPPPRRYDRGLAVGGQRQRDDDGPGCGRSASFLSPIEPRRANDFLGSLRGAGHGDISDICRAHQPRASW